MSSKGEISGSPSAPVFDARESRAELENLVECVLGGQIQVVEIRHREFPRQSSVSGSRGSSESLDETLSRFICCDANKLVEDGNGEILKKFSEFRLRAL